MHPLVQPQETETEMTTYLEDAQKPIAERVLSFNKTQTYIFT